MRNALLIVSFGTSHAETRKRTIEAIEADLRAAFPERRFYRAWTSGFLRKRLRETEGQTIDSVQEAMERMRADGIADVLVQPTHMMLGAEFAAVRKTIFSCRDRFSSTALGAPLLAAREDIRTLAKVIEDVFAEVGDADMLALMGHGGAGTEPNPYQLLDADLKDDGYARFCVGTVEHDPGFAPVLRRVRERRPEKVYLAPLMVAAGDHALHDMAGKQGDSWAARLLREGVRTVCILKGMGEYPQLREIYVSHAKSAELL